MTMTETTARAVRDVFMVLLGNFTTACGIALFVVPSGLIMGGATGLGLAICRGLGLDAGTWLSLVVGAINAALFVMGLVFLGKAFAAKTLVSTISFPIFLGLVEGALGDTVLTRDFFLCAVFGGLAIGGSLSLIMRSGASSGGLDVVSLTLHKHLGLPVSPLVFACDATVLACQIPFSDRTGVLYGIVLVILTSLTLDKLLANGESRTEIEVVSPKVEEIREAVLNEIDRGCTIFYGESGYMRQPLNILKVVVSAREIHRTEQVIKQIDPTAFLTLTRVSRVGGRGFTLARVAGPGKDQ
jgi:uncharacterized membrane-anchored protein YitT (DUF2179 family)